MTVACQSCGHWPLKTVIDLGYMPAVNAMHKISDTVIEEPFFPTTMALCEKCELVQLGGEAPDPRKVFPYDYPYTTASSKILVENFRELSAEVQALKMKGPNDKLSVCDIGSNDGTLLSFFKKRGHYVLGIEPTDVADIANANGIRTIKQFFSKDIFKFFGDDKFDVVTCCNCFAHMPDINDIVEGIKTIMKPDGIFVSESHYLFSLLDTVQYDTIYHEHLRFYSLRALKNLFARHNMEIWTAGKIQTHGGSIRVYARNKGVPRKVSGIYDIFISEPTGGKFERALNQFAASVVRSRDAFRYNFANWTLVGGIVVGIGAPSRGTILINYLGLNHNDLSCVAEQEGSLKIGRYIPGTRIPVVAEDFALEQKPDFALILSWHMADVIMKNWRAKGYQGKFILPLPEPRIVHE